jgi:TRAP-type mannitol/chloroaromatic compound transport system permease large subunit
LPRRRPLGDIFRGCGWFVRADIVSLAMLLMFPQIVLLIHRS